MKHLRKMFVLVMLVSMVALATNASAATIIINNTDGAGEGFNDPAPWVPTGGNPATTLGQARLNAFQYAADLAGSCLVSNVVIVVNASMDPLTCNATSAVLGSECRAGMTFSPDKGKMGGPHRRSTLMVEFQVRK
jgi:hypothetical protein